MRNALVIVVIGSSLSLAAPNTHALGFGRTVNATQLGQALNFAAMIQLGSDESLGRECVSAEVFSGENKLSPGQVRVTLEPGADASERSIRVTTLGLIDEPVVTVNVTVGCGAKISRRFVAFIDPPLANLAQAEAADPEKLAPQRFDSQVAPLLAIVQAANGQTLNTPSTKAAAPMANLASTAAATAPAQAVARKPSATRQARVAAARNGAAARSASTAQVTRKRNAAADVRVARTAPAGVSRLQLEPSPVMMAERAASAASTAASALVLAQTAAAPASAPEPTTPDVQAELLAVERQRIQRLEEGTARLIAEGKATRDALTQMQSRLQAAESERYSNPLVYALAGLATLLGAAVVGLWRRQQRLAAAPQWWVAGAGASAPPAAALSDPLAAADAATDEVADLTATGPLVSPTERPWEISDSLRLPAGSAREMVSPDPLTMPGGNAETSVDQLIDLEQQAEFFVVLGQDEAAIDLLMSHVRSNGGASPLPYLKLLEIYRRCDDRAAYDRIRARFNRRFDAAAPPWGADLQLGRSLTDYPELLARLQALWRSPHEVMDALETSLFRRSKTDTAFDLPAYRELLFLFSIARDLSGDDSAAPEDDGDAVVDLFLPIDVAPAAAPLAEDMTVTRSLPNDTVSPSSMALDFDVSMPAELAAVAEPEPAAASPKSPDTALRSNVIDFNDVPSRPGELAYRR